MRDTAGIIAFNSTQCIAKLLYNCSDLVKLGEHILQCGRHTCSCLRLLGKAFWRAQILCYESFLLSGLYRWPLLQRIDPSTRWVYEFHIWPTATSTHRTAALTYHLLKKCDKWASDRIIWKTRYNKVISKSRAVVLHHVCKAVGVWISEHGSGDGKAFGVCFLSHISFTQNVLYSTAHIE